jgi:hypothetical protein
MLLLYSEVLALAWRVDEEIGAYSCGQIHVFQVGKLAQAVTFTQNELLPQSWT